MSLRVNILLDQGKVNEAAEPLLDLLRQGYPGAIELAVEAVDQTRQRVEDLTHQPDEKAAAELARARKQYIALAEALYAWAEGNLRGEKLLPFKQALAGAYEGGSAEQVRTALSLYQELQKAEEGNWLVLRGLARCYRQLGQKDKAQKLYETLSAGLPSKSAAWWRVHLEQVEFWLDAYANSADVMKTVITQIRLLATTDSRMGGYADQFNEAAAAAQKRLRQLEN
jgi:tetratricopeptide (TPR) repeat protein